MHYDFLAE